jgi:aspartyl protease family protein
LRAVLAALTVLACAGAAAQSVTLQGMLGRKALIIVDGAAPRSVGPGETHQGVKVLSTSGDEAVLEFGGRRHTLRVGEAPASVGGASGSARGTRIVLPVGSGGHVRAQGAINGQAADFLVDTGATAVSLSAQDARRFGLDYEQGRRVTMSTANGNTAGWVIKLSSVRVGDVEIHEVDAIVSQQPMPFVLLGNSFLNRFQMRREHDQMILERRY